MFSVFHSKCYPLILIIAASCHTVAINIACFQTPTVQASLCSNHVNIARIFSGWFTGHLVEIRSKCEQKEIQRMSGAAPGHH